MAEPIYQVVTMSGTQFYTRKQFDKKYPKQQPNTNMRLRDEIRNAPVVRELLGPMWGGTKDGKDVVRYEDAAVHKQLSETKERIKAKANISFDFISEVTVDDMALTQAEKKKWIVALVDDLAKDAYVSPRDYKVREPNVNSSGSLATAQIDNKKGGFDIICKSEGINDWSSAVDWSYKFVTHLDTVDNLDREEAVILFGNLIKFGEFDYEAAITKDSSKAETVGDAIKAGDESTAQDLLYDCLKRVMYAKSIEFEDFAIDKIDVFLEFQVALNGDEIVVRHPKNPHHVNTLGLQKFYQSIKKAIDSTYNIDCAYRIVPQDIDEKKLAKLGAMQATVRIEFRT